MVSEMLTTLGGVPNKTTGNLVWFTQWLHSWKIRCMLLPHRNHFMFVNETQLGSRLKSSSAGFLCPGGV